MKRSIIARVLATIVAGAGLAPIAAAAMSAPGQPGTFPPNSQPYGAGYAQWSAKWWQWGLSLPVDGHPFVDSPNFRVDEGQSGPVWFLWFLAQHVQ